MQRKSSSAKEMRKANRKTMPLGLYLKTAAGMMFAGGNHEKRVRLMKEIASRRRFTQPRETIPWNPSVDPNTCDGCGVCVSFCPKGVFVQDDGAGISVVVNPASCVFLCTGCVAQCPKGAISFPDRNDFLKYVYYV
jgi:NAD-dependent dihydropyrimidine dehydrogenase PreA subunit